MCDSKDSKAPLKAREALTAEEEERLDNEARKNVVPILNKEDEPEFKLDVKPDKCVIFRSDELVTKRCSTSFTVTNNTGKRQALKFKSTSRVFFRVTPPITIVQNKTTVKIFVSCCLKDEPLREDHRLALYHITVEDNTKPATVWRPDTKPEGIKYLPCLFLHRDNTHYTEEDLLSEQLRILEEENNKLERIYAKEVKINEYWESEFRRETLEKAKREKEAMNKKKDGTEEEKE